MPIRDKYALASSFPFCLKLAEEANVNLELVRSPCRPDTRIKGRVFDECGHRAAHAQVIIYSRDGEKRYEVKTNRKGRFTLERLVPPGCYLIRAAAEGYGLSEPLRIEVKPAVKTRVALRLAPCADYSLGTIYGRVFDETEAGPLENCAVTLRYYASPHRLVAETMTNRNGQFLIYDLEPGAYLLSAERIGYRRSDFIALRVTCRSRVLQDILLTPVSRPKEGAVTGTIVYRGAPQPGIPVFLYHIRADGQEEIVRIQYTNRSGDYCFTGLPEGCYIVKSKLQQEGP